MTTLGELVSSEFNLLGSVGADQMQLIYENASEEEKRMFLRSVQQTVRQRSSSGGKGSRGELEKRLHMLPADILVGLGRQQLQAVDAAFYVVKNISGSKVQRILKDDDTKVVGISNLSSAKLEKGNHFRLYGLKQHPGMTEPQVDKDSPRYRDYKKTVALHDELEALLSATEIQDKDLIAAGRKLMNANTYTGVFFQNRWVIEYLKEYVSKVRKTERTVLRSKGFTIDSDLEVVTAAYQQELDQLKAQAGRYAGESTSPRWEELRKEIERKKSALQVEGRTAEERAGEFARLNYLLDYRVELAPVAEESEEEEGEEEGGMTASELLELEALALELELELLEID